MTNTHVTRSLIYLNLNDTDGLIDLARSGINLNNITPLQFELIQRLALAIIQPITPDGCLASQPVDFDDVQGCTNAVGAGMHRNGDDDPSAEQTVETLFEGRIALAVYPLAPLAPVDKPTPQLPQQAQDSELQQSALFEQDRLTL